MRFEPSRGSSAPLGLGTHPRPHNYCLVSLRDCSRIKYSRQFCHAPLAEGTQESALTVTALWVYNRAPKGAL